MLLGEISFSSKNGLDNSRDNNVKIKYNDLKMPDIDKKEKKEKSFLTIQFKNLNAVTPQVNIDL